MAAAMRLPRGSSLANYQSERAKAGAKFGDVAALYRTEHLPTPRHSAQSTNGYLLSSSVLAAIFCYSRTTHCEGQDGALARVNRSTNRSRKPPAHLRVNWRPLLYVRPVVDFFPPTLRRVAQSGMK
jgi:hypothetical protein